MIPFYGCTFCEWVAFLLVRPSYEQVEGSRASWSPVLGTGILLWPLWLLARMAGLHDSEIHDLFSPCTSTDTHIAVALIATSAITFVHKRGLFPWPPAMRSPPPGALTTSRGSRTSVTRVFQEGIAVGRDAPH